MIRSTYVFYSDLIDMRCSTIIKIPGFSLLLQTKYSLENKFKKKTHLRKKKTHLRN